MGGVESKWAKRFQKGCFCTVRVFSVLTVNNCFVDISMSNNALVIWNDWCITEYCIHTHPTPLLSWRSIVQDPCSFAVRFFAKMIVRSKFPAVSIPEDVTYPELMLNKFDQYGDRVAMVGFIGVCIGPGVLIYCTNTYVHPNPLEHCKLNGWNLYFISKIAR